MRTLIFCLIATMLVLTNATAQAKERPKHVDDKPIDVPIPSGAVHIVIPEGKLDQMSKDIFTFYPYPRAPYARIIPVNSSGVYRVEITPEGKVVAVTILKTLGKRLDSIALKNFLTWKAKPGPLRVVDITWFYQPGYSRGGGLH